MAATVSDVITQARNNLLDTSAVSGQLLTDNQYLGLVNEALLELLQSVRNNQQYRVIRVRATKVPKNTSYVDMDIASDFPGFGYAIDCWMQSLTDYRALTSISGTGYLTLNWSGALTLSVGQPVLIGGFSETRVGGEFPIYQVNSTTSITVAAQMTSSFTAPPGWMMYGSSGWGSPLRQIPVIPGMPATPGSGDGWIAFTNEGAQFTPASSDRMLKIRYALGGNQTVASTDVLDLQEGVPVLGQLLALKAGNALGASEDRLNNLRVAVYGDNSKRIPGSLALLRRAVALQRQNQQIVRPRWRARHAPVYPTVVQSS